MASSSSLSCCSVGACSSPGLAASAMLGPCSAGDVQCWMCDAGAAASASSKTHGHVRAALQTAEKI